ncbi:alpha/beta hydrolase [Mesorhizobium sp. M7A.F.Ca.US.006.01.1.1]|uniref:alpha/beta fold hydrolase n=1 Tax=Mesorhizobium sp. M7A.F.Ca.US.006.01.1.1 TaxID=2496707 RepID=UPI0013E40BE2|nr:alpha/beta hydrolase [Mesorhizobium sp. M7A.F.Ca.US.006.01.1.1]
MSAHEPQHYHVETRLGRVRYVVAESAGDDPVLLLLPQAGRSWRMYCELIPLLSARFRVVSLDYPGCGESAPLPEGVSVGDLADAAVEVLDALGVGRAHLYGIHFGNKVGAALAARWPARIGHVVLAGQSHSILPNSQKRLGTVGKTRRKLLAAGAAGEEELVQWSDSFTRLATIWWSDGVVRNIGSSPARLLAARRAVDEIQSLQGVPGYYRANFRFDLEAAAAQIASPALVLEIATPVEDATIGRQGEALAAVIPGGRCRVIELPDGHGISLEDHAEEVAAILLEWLPARSLA